MCSRDGMMIPGWAAITAQPGIIRPCWELLGVQTVFYDFDLRPTGISAAQAGNHCVKKYHIEKIKFSYQLKIPVSIYFWLKFVPSMQYPTICTSWETCKCHRMLLFFINFNNFPGSLFGMSGLRHSSDVDTPCPVHSKFRWAGNVSDGLVITKYH